MFSRSSRGAGPQAAFRSQPPSAHRRFESANKDFPVALDRGSRFSVISRACAAQHVAELAPCGIGALRLAPELRFIVDALGFDVTPTWVLAVSSEGDDVL